jgi:hypothetical protein
VGDPELNLLACGPHPTKDHDVFHWFEMCDAVQSETDVIDGQSVSNFVLPLYFTASHERGSRNDFLGTVTDGKTLRSFGCESRRLHQLLRPSSANTAKTRISPCPTTRWPGNVWI